MVAVFAVILALAGAPSNTTVGCYPHIPQLAATDGRTLRDSNGGMHVELKRWVCDGLIYAAADRDGRDLAAAHNPRAAENYPAAMLVALHEAFHAAEPGWSECQVETAAWKHLPTLLQRFTPKLWRGDLSLARLYHERLPANYRYGC